MTNESNKIYQTKLEEANNVLYKVVDDLQKEGRSLKSESSFQLRELTCSRFFTETLVICLIRQYYAFKVLYQKND